MRGYLQLIINPGSTSTKIAVFQDDKEIFAETLRHSVDELEPFLTIFDQFAFRREIILKSLLKAGIKQENLKAVVGRGGLLKPIPGGTYLVDKDMLRDLQTERRGSHASNLGGILADSIARELGAPAFVVDPVSVDEMSPLARLSGMPENPRESLFHALNQKAVGIRAAVEMGKEYQEVNLIIAHLGGGISVGAHLKGRVVDVNNAIPGEGPYSPERSGGVPAGRLVEICFSGRYSQAEIRKKLMGKGGLAAYLQTSNAMEVEDMINHGNEEAKLAYEGMAYQVAKEIGACGAVLQGMVDAVVITGGLAHSTMLVDMIRPRIDFIAQVLVYPGEDEMESLALGGLRVLTGQEAAKTYSEEG